MENTSKSNLDELKKQNEYLYLHWLSAITDARLPPVDAMSGLENCDCVSERVQLMATIHSQSDMVTLM
jgi:hypothetical protein